MFVQGHASNSITRIPESMKGLAKLELLVGLGELRRGWLHV